MGTKIAIHKSSFPKAVTPPGKAVFPKLNKPDTKFKKDGQYEVTLRLPNAEAAPIREAVEKFLDFAYAAQCKQEGDDVVRSVHSPIKAASEKIDKKRVPIPGFTDLKFVRRASGERKDKSIWTAKVALVDASGQPMSDEIWGGSTIRCAFTMKPYFVPSTGFGVSLELRGVQVLELVGPDGEISASALGFTAVEGGFVTTGVRSPSTPVQMEEDDAAPADSDDAEDF